MRGRRTVMGISTALLLAAGIVGSASAAPAAPTPAGDAVPVAMSTEQAARVYLNGICPMDRATDVLLQAQEDEADWSSQQPLISALARAQLRVSRVLDSPPRPWPGDIRAYIPAVSALQNVQSGMNYILASAGSVEEYQRLVKGLQAPAPALVRLSEAYWEALDVIKRRLDLPRRDVCEGFA